MRDIKLEGYVNSSISVRGRRIALEKILQVVKRSIDSLVLKSIKLRFG